MTAAYDGLSAVDLDRLVELADIYERPVLTLSGFYAVDPVDQLTDASVDLWPVAS